MSAEFLKSYSRILTKNLFQKQIGSFNNQYIFFRDNGITTQIMTYQLYVEAVFVFWMVIFGLIPIERNLLMLKINTIIAPFLAFVIQPLFYLNGDVNFRRRVLHQGLWKALKKELFDDS